MNNYYEELGLSPSMSLEELQDTLERERRKWANRTNSADDSKRKDAENKVKLIDEALDGAFADESSRKSYDSALSQARETAERSRREREAAERNRRDREAAEERKRLEEREQEIQRQKEAEEQQLRKRMRKRRRRKRVLRLVILLLILGGVGYYYYTRHIQPVQELYNTAEAAMNSGDYGTACADYFDVNEAWFSKFLFKDAYDKGYEACTLWLGQEPVITTEEECPWFSLDEDGGLEFDEDDFPADAEFQLPTILDGVLVTGIAPYGFENCKSIYYVELPANYRWIGEKAFSGCGNISSVTLSSVESIGARAFCDCDNLITVTVTGGLNTLDTEAFYECGYLMTVTLNEGLTAIGEKAFYHCPYLQGITIPGTVESIGNFAFADSGLASLQFAEGAGPLVIGEQAFAACNNLTTIAIPANVTEIGPEAFKDCGYLTTVTIGDGCTVIGGSAFRGDTQLAYVTLGQSLHTIGEYAFAGTGLYGDLYLPASLTTIGENAFENCESLANIYTAEGTANLVIQNGAFQSCDYLLGASLIGVTQLGDSVFDNCVGMYWAELDDCLTSIGSWCFAHTSFSELTLSGGLTTIGEGAFYDNDNLTGIDIPAGVGILEASTISECESLSWIVLREGITIIRDSAICYNANLREIYYTGDEAAWNSISIGSNDQLNECTYYFNYENGG